MQGFTTKRPAVLRDGGEASMGGAGEQGAGEEMLPDPGIEPVSPLSPALASGLFTY